MGFVIVVSMHIHDLLGLEICFELLFNFSFDFMPNNFKFLFAVSLSLLLGVFAGSVKAIKAYVSGDGFGIPKVLDYPVTLRTFQRTFSSMPFILPDSKFWSNDEVRC